MSLTTNNANTATLRCPVRGDNAARELGFVRLAARGWARSWRNRPRRWPLALWRSGSTHH